MSSPRKNVLIAFGSPSDMDKSVGRKDASPGELTRYLFEQNLNTPDTSYWLTVNSAYRTSEVLQCHAPGLEGRQWDAVVACAGMTNELKTPFLRYSPTAIKVAVPMNDPATMGLSAQLSSSEMPSGYPVAMSGLDDVYMGIKFANFALSKAFKKIYLDADESEHSAKVILDAEKILAELGVPVMFIGGDYLRGELILFAYREPERFPMRAQEFVLCPFSAPFTTSQNEDDYLLSMKLHPNYLHTGVANGKNLGLYAAQIVARHDGDVRARIAEHIEKGRAKYDPYKELIPLI